MDGSRRDVVLQQGDDVLVHPLLGHVDGEAVHVVLDVPVGAVVQQGLGSLVGTLPGGQVQRGLVLVVLGIPIGTVL